MYNETDELISIQMSGISFAQAFSLTLPYLSYMQIESFCVVSLSIQILRIYSIFSVVLFLVLLCSVYHLQSHSEFLISC